MPEETQNAVDWALQQKWEDYWGGTHEITKDSPHFVIAGKVREYFNEHDINYDTFSWDDLDPYVEASEYN